MTDPQQAMAQWAAKWHVTPDEMRGLAQQLVSIADFSEVTGNTTNTLFTDLPEAAIRELEDIFLK